MRKAEYQQLYLLKAFFNSFFILFFFLLLDYSINKETSLLLGENTIEYIQKHAIKHTIKRTACLYFFKTAM